MSLRERTSVGAGPFEAREVSAGELDAILDGANLQVHAAAAVPRAPWRAFVVVRDGRAVHHSFVTFERPTPRLFNVFTDPDVRGQGVFDSAMAVVKNALVDDGYDRLESSCSAANRPSVRAHRAVGFRIIGRSYHPYAFGVDLRPWVGRVLAPLRGR